MSEYATVAFVDFSTDRTEVSVCVYIGTRVCVTVLHCDHRATLGSRKRGEQKRLGRE